MTVFLTLFGFSLMLTAWAYRGILNNMRNRIRQYAEEEQAIEERYLHLTRRKRQLEKDIQDIKNRAILMQRDITAATQPPAELFEQESDDATDEDMKRAADFMLAKGLITVDQNERALGKMATMQMDYLGVCITLGYIDLDAARNVVKTLGIHHSTLSVSN